MSEAHKGTNTGAKNGRARRIVQLDDEGNIIREWDYITQASNALNITRTGINACCVGKR